jgi:hypothetical protein
MRGKSWWSCGESVAGNDSKFTRLKHANFFAEFSSFDLVRLYIAEDAKTGWR